EALVPGRRGRGRDVRDGQVGGAQGDGQRGGDVVGAGAGGPAVALALVLAAVGHHEQVELAGPQVAGEGDVLGGAVAVVGAAAGVQRRPVRVPPRPERLDVPRGLVEGGRTGDVNVVVPLGQGADASQVGDGPGNRGDAVDDPGRGAGGGGERQVRGGDGEVR